MSTIAVRTLAERISAIQDKFARIEAFEAVAQAAEALDSNFDRVLFQRACGVF